MRNLQQPFFVATAKKIVPMEKPPIRVDISATEIRQEGSPLLPVATEDSQVIEIDFILSSEHHPHQKFPSSQRHTK